MRYDVIVSGGGPAGTCAAIAAAREGLSVLLLESTGCIGGMWTSYMMMYAMDTIGKNGLVEEIRTGLQKHSAYLLMNETLGHFLYDVETMKRILENLCGQAGVEILYFSNITDISMSDGRIAEVTVNSNGVKRQHIAPVYIDATGNGDFGLLTGCSYEMGHPESGKIQPASFKATVTGVPEDFPFPGRAEFNAILRKAGITTSNQSPTLYKNPFNDTSNMTVSHLYDVNCDEPETITRALREGRREIDSVIDILRNQPGWENLALVATPLTLGIREGRRLSGLYRLNTSDVIEGRRFDDGICLVHARVDIHALSHDSKVGFSNENIDAKPFHIPLRSLISSEVKNLMFAGRCISGDFHSHAAYRMTGTCAAMGEAAGIASAIAVKDSITCQDVDGKAVSQAMAGRGYLL